MITPARSKSNLSGAFVEFCSRLWPGLLALLALAFVAYSPALNAGFIWDDHMLVLHNLAIRTPLFALDAFRHTLFDGASSFYRPTQTITFILDYWFWHLEPFGFHLTNILIHAANGVLLFLLLRGLIPDLLSEDRAPAFLVTPGGVGVIAWLIACVWVLHPVHNAAVAYVAGRADSLTMCFCLVAWLLARRALNTTDIRSRAGLSAAAAVSLLFGLCSKEIASVWLVLFACHLLLFNTGPIRLTSKLATFGISLLTFGVYLFLRHLPPVHPEGSPPPRFNTVLLVCRALGDYGSLLFYPSRLMMERQVFPNPSLTLSFEDQFFYHSLTVSGVLFAAALLAGVCWRAPGRKTRVFGALWFVLGYLPISNIFVTINASVAEHWMYLPSIGFFIFLAGCVLPVPAPRWKPAVTVALLMAAAFGARTYARALDWRDELSFFRQTVEAGGDVPRARINLAKAYSAVNEDGKVIALLRDVVARNPGSNNALIDLGNALGRQGRYGEAKTTFESVVGSLKDSDPVSIIVVLGALDVLEDHANWPTLRKTIIDGAVERSPDSWPLVFFQSKGYRETGDLPRALSIIGKFAGRHWDHYPAQYQLGCLYAEMGRKDDAVATLKEASRLDVYDTEALSAAARVRVSDARFHEAADLQRAALRRDPRSLQGHVALAQILEKAGLKEEAARETGTAAELVREAGVTVR